MTAARRPWPGRDCLVAGVLGLIASAGPAGAQSAPLPDVKAWVQRHDSNHDGMIDRGEFQAAMIESFYFRDKNKVGYLTVEELKDSVSPEILKAVKRKDSGRITLQEYLNATFRDFEAADTDQDGLLSVEEIEIYILKTR